MKIKIYQYGKCSTCQKALKWLSSRGVAYEALDIVSSPPKRSELQLALKRGIPLKKLFNTSGLSYREGKWGERLASVTEAEALDALLADGKLIKRPFLVGNDQLIVGFDEEAYAQAFKKP